MVDEDCYYNGTPSACLDIKNDSVLTILSALAPNCERGAWTPISDAWKVFFYFKIVVFAICFLLLGVLCLVLLFKRHSTQRFQSSKTFIAIDIALAILGFSRFVFYILDPYGISGFCVSTGCIVVERLLFGLGFPSLTATYTLVFLTLWHSAKMKLGRSCIQHWRLIIPLCFVHYFVAMAVEIVVAFGPYSVVFVVLLCEAVFTLWGLIVCVTFLIAGCRVLHSIKHSVRQSSVVCRERTSVKDDEKNGTGTLGRAASSEPSSTAAGSSGTYRVTRMKRRTRRNHQQAIRKVTIITYVAATLGGLYSILNLIQLILVTMQLFGACPEMDASNYHSNTNVWLLMRYLGAIIEYSMALLLLYSINDLRPIVSWLKTAIFCCCSKDVEDNGKDKQAKKYFTDEFETSESSIAQFVKRSIKGPSGGGSRRTPNLSPPKSPETNGPTTPPKSLETNGPTTPPKSPETNISPKTGGTIISSEANATTTSPSLATPETNGLSAV